MRNPSHVATPPERERPVEARAAVPAPDPSRPWSPATVLALQRSGVGNQVIARMLAGPGRPTLAREHDWAVQGIADERSTSSLWGKSSLHHIIARERLDSLARDLARALSSKDEAVRKAAQAFWKQVELAAGDDIFAQTKSDHEPHKKTLHNLRLNLERGPEKPGDDPGSGLDPATEGSGERQTTTVVSAQLIALDAAYRQMRLEPEQAAAHWTTMTQCLVAARAAHDAERPGKVGEHEEMWFQSGGRWYRKGERAFPGRDGGRQRFQAGAAGKENIAAHHGRDTEVASALVSVDRPVEAPKAQPTRRRQKPVAAPVVAPEPIRVNVVITEGVLHHSCERHTYRHFTFDIKGVNNFWPQDFDYSTLVREAPTFADGIADHVADTMRDSIYDFVEIDNQKPKALSARNVRAGDHSLFYSGLLESDEDQDGSLWTFTLKTIAPDGKSAEAYTQEDLRALQPPPPAQPAQVG